MKTIINEFVSILWLVSILLTIVGAISFVWYDNNEAAPLLYFSLPFAIAGALLCAFNRKFRRAVIQTVIASYIP